MHKDLLTLKQITNPIMDDIQIFQKEKANPTAIFKSSELILIEKI